MWFILMQTKTKCSIDIQNTYLTRTENSSLYDENNEDIWSNIGHDRIQNTEALKSMLMLALLFIVILQKKLR